MSHIDPQPSQVRDGLSPSAPRRDTRPGTVGLLIEAIGSDHLDIRAVGSFHTDSLDRIAARLHKLVATASHLRIDFRNVADMDHAVASLFRQAATTVEAAGGTLDLVGLHAPFFRADTTTSMGVGHAPNPQRDAS